jgi:hypothetical protein
VRAKGAGDALMKTLPITIWIVPIILLAVAVLAGIDGTALPYGYFTFMRIVLCLAAGCIAAAGFREAKQLWATMFVLIALLFNPFVPIEMKRDKWLILDIITFVVFLTHAAFGRLAAIRFISEKIDRKHLKGWQRIGVVASTLWIGSVTIYAFKEISDGPSGTRFLTNLVVLTTSNNMHLVPLNGTLDLTKFCTAAFVPIAALWLGGWAVAWIASFRR